MTEIDKYSKELHNPEITLPSGSGGTPATNYKIMAPLAAISKQSDRTELDEFVKIKVYLIVAPRRNTYLPQCIFWGVRFGP